MSDILIHSLKIGVDPKDDTYMPFLIVISGGSSFSNLHELNTVYVRANDSVVTLLSDIKEVCFRNHIYLDINPIIIA